MQKIQTRRLHKTLLATAMATAIGTAAVPLTVNADAYVWGSVPPDSTNYADFTIGVGLNNPQYANLCTTDVTTESPATIVFTMLDSGGAALANSSITAKGANQFQTPTCGTLSYDTSTGTGSATIAPFDFFSGTMPARALGVDIQKITGGSGNLFMGNMLFDWNGNEGIPVSLVWDATGILGEMDGTPSSFTLNSNGSIITANAFSGPPGIDPASDGTYTNATVGYLALGPVPMASTEDNLTRAAACLPGANNCLGVSPSGTTPLVVDSAANGNEFTKGDGVGVGGVPMWDGPFTGFNANFDFNNLKLVSFTDTTNPVLTLNPHVSPAGTATVTLVVNVDTYTEPGASCTDAPPLDAYSPTVGPPTGGPVNTSVVGDTTLTYTCTDGTGNVTTKDRLVKVVGANATITLNADGNGDVSPVTQECGVAYTDAGASCLDDPDGPIAISGNGTDPGTFALDASAVNVAIVGGPYSAIWSCTDSASNNNTLARAVNVTDTTAPVITITTPPPVGTIVAGPTLVLETNDETGYANPAATASDTCDLAAIGASTTNTPVWTITSGHQVNSTLSYTATDANGQIGTLNVAVEVHRSEPVINLIGSQTLILNVGDAYVEPGMDIHDEQDTDLNGVTASGTNGTFSYGITGTVDTSTAGSYTVTYTVTTDSDGNAATPVERTVQVGVFASSSNFTMLNPEGRKIGGTNDVVFDWQDASDVLGPAGDGVGGDPSSLNMTESDLKFNMTIASAGPEDFFGAPWFAHHVRVFGPGTYHFEADNKRCESKDPSPDPVNGGDKKTNDGADDIIVTGCPGTPGGASTLTLVVPDGMLGAHMLFDYNSSFDIDVVNLWEIDGVWANPDGAASDVNDLWQGEAIDSSDGLPPDATAPWKLVSRDVNGDGINGARMVDGPFGGFYANFNAGGTTGELTCNAPAVLDSVTNTCVLTTTISDNSLDNDTLGAIGWATLFGIWPTLGLLRRRRNRR